MMQYQSEMVEGMRRAITHVFANNRAEASTPQDTLSTDFVHKQTLAAEHGFAKALALVFCYNALCAS